MKLFSKAFLIGVLGLFGIVSTSAQATGCHPIRFNLAPTYLTGPNTNAYARADFNSDGKLDIVAINVQVRTVTVLYGDGAGAFGPARVFPTEINPFSALAAGDFNNDGKPDLITASFSENKFAILLNDGNGGFLAPSVIVPPNPFPN